MSAATKGKAEVIWHGVECGGYGEDLALWEELSAQAEGPILDLGCGTGRVALHLARRGHRIHAVDVEPAFVEELGREAAAERLEIETTTADVRELVIPDREFGLAIASMQLLQLLDGTADRAAALARIAAALRPGGLAALAIVEGTEGAVGSAGQGVVPDVREVDGWLYSSLPLEVAARDGQLSVLRLRQVVSPGGDPTEAEHTDRLSILDAETIEAEGRAAGLAPAGRRPVAQSELHVGSTVVVLRREV